MKLVERVGLDHDSSARERILVVDDDRVLLDMIVVFLREAGFDVDGVETGTDAIRRLTRRRYDVALVDLKLPDMNGYQVIAHATSHDPALVAILVTGFGSSDTMATALRMGAADVIMKPMDTRRLPLMIRETLKKHRLVAQVERLERFIAEEYRLGNLVCHSEKMRDALHRIESAAWSNANVLLVGEPGTGKRHVAKAIHVNSGRKGRELLHVHCGTMSDSELARDLFGSALDPHGDEKPPKPGRLLDAHRGTLFLDSVDAMGPDLQAKFDRFLRHRILPRTGSGRSMRVDVRIIASATQGLARAAKRRSFNPHFYQALSPITIHLPPLRQRREDIAVLVHHFLNDCVRQEGGGVKSIGRQVLSELEELPWPGNVRQLRDAVEQAVLSCGDRAEIEVGDLPAAIREADPSSMLPHVIVPEQGIDMGAAMATLQRSFVDQSLRLAGGNLRKAADLLGLRKSTFVSIVKRVGGLARRAE